MSDKRILKSIVVGTGAVVALIGLAALLMVSGAPSQMSFAQEPGVGIQAAVDSVITYQGSLGYGGEPISGTCSLTFSLYNAASGGTDQVGSADTHASVPVEDGFFSVELNDGGEFGADAFIGEARWLEIMVNSCTGGGDSATLSPRVALKAVPYAHTLRPGAVVRSDLSTGYVLSVENQGQGQGLWVTSHNTAAGSNTAFFNALGQTGQTYAVHASNSSSGSGSSAGYFHSTGTTGATRGVRAEVDSTGEEGDPAVAGWFDTNATTGTTVGVLARTNSDDGVAGSFQALAVSGRTYGVSAFNSSTTFTAAAGYFHATGGGNQDAQVYGVHAKTDSPHPVSFAVFADKTTCAGPQSSNCVAIYTDDKIVAAAFDTSSSDVAEYYPSGQSLQPGDVVMADPGGGGRVVRAEGAYNQAVLGVISTAPGVSLGNNEHEGGDGNAGRAPVTLIGRVPCKVSAENGPIRPGDLLTTSSTPGHAMNAGSDPPNGTIVGKALDALEAGTGEIEILVMLQ